MKLFKTTIKQEDLSLIEDVLVTGQLGFGSNVSRFEEQFSHFSSKKYNVAVNSASAAAFMIFSFLKEKHGICDVYTTSLGFTSPAWSAKHFGHNLIFVDVQDDLQFSSKHYRAVRDLSKAATARKQVVMPVLYGGISSIDNFSLMGDEIVVIDSAHCVTPTMKSDYTFFSFHPYKPICSSDGGMISTDDLESKNYFTSYRNFGRINYKNCYNIKNNGFKFYMNNLNATIALTQIKRYEENLNIRKQNYKALSDRFLLLPHDKNSSYYFATTLVENADEVIKETGLTRNYPMLHKMDYYRTQTDLPNLERLHGKILNLPLWGRFE
tara:strand:- start:4105 stop:5076 length:972 start_codon:yes stop_codon:yes gene_type:complete